jgi:6-phosphogluconolactonase
VLEIFPSAEAAADAAAQAIVTHLALPGPRRMIVTGGSSPGPVYDRLVDVDLGWSRISVTLSDERFVDPADERSNAWLVRQRLLRGHAAAATFLPLKGHGPTPDADALAAEPAIEALLPFDAVLLGMGPDGHVASLFPSTPGVADLLDPAADRAVVGVDVAGLEPFVPRITLTGRSLMSGGLIVVVVSGQAKRALIERTLVDPTFAPPIAAVLRQGAAPVRVLWSPGA